MRIHFASDDKTKIDDKQKTANDSSNEGKRKHPEEEEEFDVEEYIRTLEPAEQLDAKAVTEVADTEISKEMKARIISINKSIALHRKARKQSNELLDAGAFTLRATLQLSKEQLQRIETNKAAAQKIKAPKIEKDSIKNEISKNTTAANKPIGEDPDDSSEEREMIV